MIMEPFLATWETTPEAVTMCMLDKVRWLEVLWFLHNMEAQAVKIENTDIELHVLCYISRAYYHIC
jgi:hypothetical protein